MRNASILFIYISFRNITCITEQSEKLYLRNNTSLSTLTLKTLFLYSIENDRNLMLHKLLIVEFLS